MTENGDRVVYTVDQVAKLLHICRSSAYQGIQTGEIPHLKIGRRILIPRLALERKLVEASSITEA